MRSPMCRFYPVLFVLFALCGCSKPSDSGGSGSGFSIPALTGSEPFRTPKYPSHAVVQPSVAPSTFSSGTPYDWEHPTPLPAHTSASFVRETFANTRTFEETTAWIKKAMATYIPSNRPPQETTRFSDFHFRGCIFEWHEESAASPEHVNEYNYSVNLGEANMSQIFSDTSSFRLGWEEENNPVLFRAWEKEDARWKLLGEQLQGSTRKDFSVSRDDMAEPLVFAFLHAARLCGAKFPVRR